MVGAPVIFLLLSFFAYVQCSKVPTSAVDSDGLVISSICHDFKDCEVTTERDSPPLALACYYDVNKCNCYNTYMSDYHLGVVGNECLMSKYGPCGLSLNKTFTIGCRDNFECIDGRCLDPADPTRTIKKIPYEFHVKSCKACTFSDDLQMECEGHETKDPRCQCEAIYMADKRRPVWDLRNYDGHHKCSSGEHGPCGVKHGVEISCHGDGIKCVKGRCKNAARPNPLSGAGESCGQNSDCQKRMVCSTHYKCIRRHSVPAEGACIHDDECKKGHYCGFDHSFDPYNPSICIKGKKRGNRD